MNQLTTYEIAIAEKVQQLPLPNMADSIWASIEQQLDMDLHADENPASNQPAAKLPLKAIIAGGIITVIVVAVLLIVQLNKKNKRSSIPNKPAQPTQTIPNDKVGPSPGPQQILQGSSTVPFESKVPVNKDSSSLADKNRTADSIQTLPPVFINPALPDLKTGNPITIQPPPPDTNAVKPGATKPRGVKGITDNDYRISAGKDSAKKGG